MTNFEALLFSFFQSIMFKGGELMDYSMEILPNGIVVRNFKIKAKGTSKKVFYQISDAHLAVFDELSSEEDKNWAIKQTQAWLKTRAYVAKEHGEAFNDMSKSSKEYFENAIAEVKNADALILSGDICDYISDANMRFLETELKKVKVPIISVCGNHENAAKIKDGYIFSKTKESVSLLEFDDLCLVGIDNSLKRVTKSQAEAVKDILKINKPVILVMHTPIKTEDTAEIFKEVGDYYALNHNQQTKSTKEFIELLKQNDDKIILVLAGHLHFKTVGHITNKLCQITASQNLTGNIFRYEIS